MLLAFGIWAYLFEIDEVSTGTGKVIPTSREQVIQSLEGGIVAELNVSEGDIVKQGEILAKLDPTKTESNFGESAAKYRASLASVARLQAEVKGVALKFPDELKDYPALMAAALASHVTYRDWARAPTMQPNETNKGISVARSRLSALLQRPLYDLDRLDLSATSTL
ncbi:biotin/lipoyl-binding protein, partial [Pseudomonas psychrophila]|uniref:biotin/lipoyl-binding protein n=1 Tax=Pseudomonas psychrophila TaxID=122355 RepID=UPI001EFA237C